MSLQSSSAPDISEWYRHPAIWSWVPVPIAVRIVSQRIVQPEAPSSSVVPLQSSSTPLQLLSRAWIDSGIKVAVAVLAPGTRRTLVWAGAQRVVLSIAVVVAVGEAHPVIQRVGNPVAVVVQAIADLGRT